MKKRSFDDHRFRCSSLGKIMTNSRSKKDPLSVTCKNYLQEIHKEVVFGKTREIQSKYLDKGNQVEDLSISLYNMINASSYQKNVISFTNDFISGTPDILSDQLIDIKSSWDFTTFPMHQQSLPSKDYYWQMQGYMMLTEKKTCKVAYCLVDTPETLIQDELRRLSWNLGMIEVPMDLESEVYERLQYSDIPDELRVKEFIIEYNEQDIESLKKRIDLCREYLSEININVAEKLRSSII